MDEHPSIGGRAGNDLATGLCAGGRGEQRLEVWPVIQAGLVGRNAEAATTTASEKGAQIGRSRPPAWRRN